MLRKIILDSDKSYSSSSTEAGGKPTKKSLKRKRRRLPKKRVKSKRRFNKKIKTMRKTIKRKKKPLQHYKYAKCLEMRKRDRDDIDKNKNQIRAIASFLQSLTQLLATPKTVAVPQLQI